MTRRGDRLLRAARQFKHRAFLAWKFKHLHLRHVEPLREARQRRRSLELDATLVARSFLRNDVADTHDPAAPVPRVIWCIWAAENAMSPARLNSFEAIRRIQEGFDVRLVTPKTLGEVVLKDAPLHPQYENLSAVHRSDYLRGYLLHHHGGGYIDIKRPRQSWHGVMDDFEAGGYWIAGYPEIAHTLIPQPHPFGSALRDRSSLITGQGAFLARPGTPFTGEWMDEMHRRLDAASEGLTRHPGNLYGDNDGYPLGWVDLLATVTEPLQCKYPQHVLRDKRLLVSVKNYR